jgi:hypothetical protein
MIGGFNNGNSPEESRIDPPFTGFEPFEEEKIFSPTSF